jgi:choline-sulfatase
LFDLERDPGERTDLGPDPAHEAELREWRSRLEALCVPDDVDRRAKARQAELVERFGGEAAIRAAPGIGGYTPSPVH